MKNRRILISGASIAGPALAYWLHRHGFEPTIVERARAPRDGGQAIDVRGAAIEVTARMGILDDIRRASTDMRGMSFVDGAGKPLVNMTGLTLTGGLTGSGDVEIMRGDFTRILYGETRDRVEYIFDDSMTSLTPSDGGVHVTFERSAPRTFDLVIGADGVHSNVRTLAFGSEPRFLRRLGVYLSVFSTTNFLGLDRWQVYHQRPTKLVGIYSARENREARAMFAFAAPTVDFDPRDGTQQKELVAQQFAGEEWEGWVVPRLLEAMWDARDFYFDSMSQVIMDRWSLGRIALVGDAGYGPSPLSGQGTSLALVGAYVLAGELQATGGDYEAAFARYEKGMRHYVAQNQSLAIAAVQRAPKTRLSLWLQIQGMRVLSHLPWRRRIVQRGMRPLARAANAIALRDYAAAARAS